MIQLTHVRGQNYRLDTSQRPADITSALSRTVSAVPSMVQDTSQDRVLLEWVKKLDQNINSLRLETQDSFVRHEAREVEELKDVKIEVAEIKADVKTLHEWKNRYIIGLSALLGLLFIDFIEKNVHIIHLISTIGS